MHTHVEQAQRGRITPQMEEIARSEGMDPHELCERIAAGSAVIMQRGSRVTGIGKGLSTKVNVNLGTSSTKVCIDDEIKKAQIAETFGADTISDLSMGGDINATTKGDFFKHHTPDHDGSRVPGSRGSWSKEYDC